MHVDTVQPGGSANIFGNLRKIITLNSNEADNFKTLSLN